MTQKIQPATLNQEELNARLKDLKTYEDAQDFITGLLAPTLQGMLEAERDNHLEYPKYHPSGHNKSNSRNGYSDKTLKSTRGNIKLKIPRDRDGSFEPQVIKKYETHTGALDDQIINLYAKGNSTRQIADFAKEMYGVNVSADMVSAITDKILPLVEEWKNRPLKKIYPIIYLDGLHLKIREGGKIVSKCVYIILGIDSEGKKECLGFWIGETESAKFWLGVLNEIKNRGVEDILICCIDGLTGFREAIQAVYPQTEIQDCIIHKIRSTTKFIPHKDKKAFCKDLKTVYTATTEEAGYSALQDMKTKWEPYAVYLKSWEENWGTLSTFFIYPAEIRKIIYTTNPIESLNRQFRRVTKTTCIFPHDTAAAKLLWLAQKDITKKWTTPIQNWGTHRCSALHIF